MAVRISFRKLGDNGGFWAIIQEGLQNWWQLLLFTVLSGHSTLHGTTFALLFTTTGACYRPRNKNTRVLIISARRQTQRRKTWAGSITLYLIDTVLCLINHPEISFSTTVNLSLSGFHQCCLQWPSQCIKMLKLKAGNEYSDWCFQGIRNWSQHKCICMDNYKIVLLLHSV